MSETKYTIKEVDGTDPKMRALLEYLHRDCLPVDDVYDTARGWWWVGYHGSEPVAFAGLVPTIQDETMGYLCRAGVIYAHRGRGLQRRLIQVRERKAKKLGMRALVSDTRQNPSSSNNLYACGFKMYEPYSPWAHEDSLYWIKKL